VSIDSAFWRRMAYAGARYGPEAWVRVSPPVIGLACALALGPARRRVRANLRRVHGPRRALEERWDVARTFVSYAGCLTEGLACERPAAQRATRRFRDDGLSAALGAGGGLIVGTAHFGAWDAAAPLLARDFARPVLVVMAPEPDARARSLHDGVRERAGVRVLHVGAHPADALPLLHHLRDGGVVAVQLDRAPPGGRVLDVPFLGGLMSMPAGPFALAALSGAPLLPVFVRRAGRLEYEVGGGPAIRLPRRAGHAELSAAAALAARELERSVRACPTQWFDFG
jgi:KDO2-lipid IV(A) lauroyltransferase